MPRPTGGTRFCTRLIRKDTNMTPRQAIVFSLALLFSTPSFGHHPPPPVPPPAPAPVVTTVASTPAWLFPLMALPIIWFVVEHYSNRTDR